MDKDAINLLNKDRVGVISVILIDGALHSAAVHYSYKNDPLKIYIQTTNATLKAQPFLDGKIDKGAFVVGFREDEWLTLQMHGTVRAVLDKNELEAIYTVHYQKHPDAEQFKGPNTVFLEFTPTWWRYTDFNTDPETIVVL